MKNNIAELYTEEVTPVNEIRGFTKSFRKKTKEKKEEDVDVLELLGFARERRLLLGARITEKILKRGGKLAKVFVASNCDGLALQKIEHYSKVAKVPVVSLDLDNEELAQKLGKPFYVSMVCVRGD